MHTLNAGTYRQERCHAAARDSELSGQVFTRYVSDHRTFQKVNETRCRIRMTSHQETAFTKIKEILTRGPVLRYFDVSKPVTVSCDASQSGLGSVLLQDNKPAAYASRSMTDAETRYAQIEKELLAVLFGMERFHQYSYEREVTVECDHLPIESIV